MRNGEPCPVRLVFLALSILVSFYLFGFWIFITRGGSCLGIENKKGTLRAGADADLVVLDRSGVVLSTWVRGREVWAKEM